MDVGQDNTSIDASSLPNIVVTGDIDFTNAGELCSAVESAVLSGEKHIFLDLSEAGFLDSSGIGALLSCRKRAAGAGCTLCIKEASRQVLRALQLSGFAGLFGLPLLRVDSTRCANNERLQTVDWNISESVVLGEPELIGALREIAMEAARQSGLAEEHAADVQLAVGEALSNALRHGSPKGGENKIRLRCMSCPSAMVVEITDEGQEFDFEHIVSSGPSGEGHGGIGVRLICRAMDEVECKHTGRGNRIRMIKWLK